MEFEHESQWVLSCLVVNTVSDPIAFMIMAWLKALLLLSGDIETNPGPPKNRGPPGGVDLVIQRLD